MLAAVRRVLHLNPGPQHVPPDDDPVLHELQKVTDREQQRAEEIRRMRLTGNFVEGALLPIPQSRKQGVRRD